MLSGLGNMHTTINHMAGTPYFREGLYSMPYYGVVLWEYLVKKLEEGGTS